MIAPLFFPNFDFIIIVIIQNFFSVVDALLLSVF